MRKVFTILLLTIAFSMSLMSTHAQNAPQNGQYFYVLATNLNVDNYATLHQQLKNDGRFEITSACIPSHVMKIKVISTNGQNTTLESNKETFKSFIGNISLGAISTPANYSEQMFMDACKAARTGN
ncbi:MAG: hypothetical protein K1X54_05250 [Flavobacteriales bacterium]|nr:hypothetical protein [Flavobacteriales bacterium]